MTSRETDFSNEKYNFNRGKLINSDNKSQKKKINGPQRKIKKSKDEKNQEKSLIKSYETMSNTVLKRCLGCNFDHFPLPKFCRWWEERKSVKKGPWRETMLLSFEESIIVKKSIQYLEEKFGEKSKTPKEEIIVNNFFERSSESCNPEEIHDILNLTKVEFSDILICWNYVRQTSSVVNQSIQS